MDVKEPQPLVGEKGGVAHDELPPPTTASTPKKYRETLLKRLLFVGVMAVWLSALRPIVFRQPSNRLVDLTDIDDGGYWAAVASKGLRKALPWSGHHKHHHHDDAAHSHSMHPPLGRPPRLIPPKMAEHIFLSVPNNDSARETSKLMTAAAHPAGSGFDATTALAVKELWEEALALPVSGPLDHLYMAGSAESQARVRGGMGKMGVWIDQYFPVMNTPVHASITLKTDPPFHAKLQEDIIKEDDSSIYRDSVPVFHGLSVSGDVTGKYVYAGYGRKSDFDLLQSKGVNFTKKIALVKYGGSFRGLKVKAAQEAGAVGCIIFTDPANDGDMTEANGHKPYPDGPARQPSSVQRGSTQFISAYPGDPTTPGKPAYENATRLEGGNQPSIPSIPISYTDAIPLLKALEGKGIPAKDLGDEWSGGLGYYGVEYFVGPSDEDLHFVNEVNTRVMPIWNVMATIPGHVTDEVIVVGNHRDAWVMGAGDPNSGTASQMEVVKGLGKLLRMGWKPLRTIVLASWDAEEYGLIGSTEWCEDFGDWLGVNAAGYLNLDVSVAGSSPEMHASPSLAWLLRHAAQKIMTDADPTQSIWDVASASAEAQAEWIASNPSSIEALEAGSDGSAGLRKGEIKKIGALGSGSDFTPFLQRYGVASSDFGYKPGKKDPVYHYHSIYDSFFWMDNFGDPGFHRHVDVAKILGLMVLRMADSLVLPINTTQYALELEEYLVKVEHVAKDLHKSDDLHLSPLGKAIDGVKEASEELDKHTKKVLKELKKALPKHPKHKHGLLRGLWRKMRRSGGCHEKEEREALWQMTLWTDTAQEDKDVARSSDLALPHLPHLPLPSPGKIKEIKRLLEEVRTINKKLQHFEQGLISEEGLKDREWYKHKGVAPGLWLGYGATTFPGVTEALTAYDDVELAQKEADELVVMLNKMAEALKP